MNSDSSWPKSQKQRPIRPSVERKRDRTSNSPALPPVLFELPNLADDKAFGRIDTPQTEGNAVPPPAFASHDPPAQEQAVASGPKPTPFPAQETDAVLTRWGSRGMVIGLLFVLFGAAIFFIMQQEDRKAKTAQATTEPDSVMGDLATTQLSPTSTLELAADPSPTPTTVEQTADGPKLDLDETVPNKEVVAEVTPNAFAGLNAPGQTDASQEPATQIAKKTTIEPTIELDATDTLEVTPDLESQTTVSLDSPMLDTDPQALADLEPPTLEPLEEIAASTTTTGEASDSVEVISALPENTLAPSQDTEPNVPDLPDLSEAVATPDSAEMTEPEDVAPSTPAPLLSTNPISAEIENAPHSSPEPFSDGGSPFQFSTTPMGVADWTRYLPMPTSQPIVPATQPGIPYTP